MKTLQSARWLLAACLILGLLISGMAGWAEAREYRTYYVDVDIDGDGKLDERWHYVSIRDLIEGKTPLWKHKLDVDPRSMLLPEEIIKKYPDGTLLKRDRTGRRVIVLPDGTPLHHMCWVCWPYFFGAELDVGFYWHMTWWRLSEALKRLPKDERSGKALQDNEGSRGGKPETSDLTAGAGTVKPHSRLFVHENGQTNDLRVSVSPMQTGWAGYVAPFPSSEPSTGNAFSGSLQDAKAGGSVIYQPPKPKPKEQETYGNDWVRYYRNKGDRETADWLEPYVMAEDKKAFGRERAKQIPSLPPVDPHTFHTSNYYGNETPPVIVQPPGKEFRPDELYRVRDRKSLNRSVPQALGKETIPVQGMPVIRQHVLMPQEQAEIQQPKGTAPTYQPMAKGALGGVGVAPMPLIGGAHRGK